MAKKKKKAKKKTAKKKTKKKAKKKKAKKKKKQYSNLTKVPVLGSVRRQAKQESGRNLKIEIMRQAVIKWKAHTTDVSLPFFKISLSLN